MIAGHYVIPEVNFKYKIDNCVTFMKKKNQQHSPNTVFLMLNYKLFAGPCRTLILLVWLTFFHCHYHSHHLFLIIIIILYFIKFSYWGSSEFN